MKDSEIKKLVRESYANIAEKQESCCAPVSGCCTGEPAKTISDKIGYSEEQLTGLPKDADMGLGCGNPVGLSQLKAGETVLDLGSGGGIDCFLAAKAVGEKGKVIGVDMTPEMIDKARRNASKGGYDNVEFRLGEIDHLPAADNSVDAIISNCVINLAPDKAQVFQEAYRVLKPGGRFMVSDMVLTGELPVGLLSSVSAYAGCISGAMQKEKYLDTIKEAGFQKIEILKSSTFTYEIVENDQTAQALLRESTIPEEKVNQFLDCVESITVVGYKP